jgi:probable F420-dependent oxidoreductase
MKFGMAGMFGGSRHRGMAFAKDYAVCCEELGFSGLYLPEHVVFFGSYTSAYPYTPDGTPSFGPRTGLYDPLLLCAYLAGATSRIRLVTSVLILPERPALLVAKEVMTLDHAAEGRFDLGLGIGWSSEEYAALDMPFDHRGKRCDEYLEAIRAAWTEDPASYHGTYVDFSDVVLLPKPVNGSVPLIVGGDSRAAMRRAARLGDGWYGFWAGVELEAHLGMLREVMASHGRTQDNGFQIRLGLPIGGETPEQVASMADQARSLGVDELVLTPTIRTAGFEDALRGWAEAVDLQPAGSR